MSPFQQANSRPSEHQRRFERITDRSELAVVQVSSAEQGDVHLQSIDGPKLGFIDLPYDVPLEREA